MKKVLGIIGSRRKLGNSEIIIKEISKNIPVEHELRILRLSDFKIDYCRACYSCVEKRKNCVIGDDFQIIVDEMCNADGFIVASPTYFLTAHASLFQLLDRFLTLYTYSEQIWNKPAVAVGIAGMAHKSGSTETILNLFLNVMMCKIKGIEIMQGAFPGEIVTFPNNIILAKKLASALFGEKIDDEKPRCNICGNNSFSFESNNNVKCLVCSNSGKFELIDSTIKFQIDKVGADLFLNENSAQEHSKWLGEMKKKFFEEISTFKQIRDKYSNYGIEIKP